MFVSHSVTLFGVFNIFVCVWVAVLQCFVSIQCDFKHTKYPHPCFLSFLFFWNFANGWPFVAIID